MQKTLDKGRRHELDYRTLILYLVHFLEEIHNIWMSAVVLLLFSRGMIRSCFVKKVVLKQLAPILN
jgi:hypothetical protein